MDEPDFTLEASGSGGITGVVEPEGTGVFPSTMLDITRPMSLIDFARLAFETESRLEEDELTGKAELEKGDTFWAYLRKAESGTQSRMFKSVFVKRSKSLKE